MILLTWIVPFLISLMICFTTNLDSMTMCAVTQKWPNFVSVFFVLAALVVIFILYGMILFKYWGQKRKMSAMRKKTHGNAKQRDDVQKGKVIGEKAQKIMKFLENSKYVIVVVSVFTVCWMPWIILVFYDITVHQLGSLQKTKETQCSHYEALSNQILTIEKEYLGQSCIYGLMSGSFMQCEVPGDEKDVCEEVHEHLHDFLIVCIIRLCMCFAVLNSLINPIVHGLWFPGFREAVIYLRNR